MEPRLKKRLTTTW